jgi:hypothetical protein
VEELVMRGFEVNRCAHAEFNITTPGKYVLSGEGDTLTLAKS